MVNVPVVLFGVGGVVVSLWVFYHAGWGTVKVEPSPGRRHWYHLFDAIGLFDRPLALRAARAVGGAMVLGLSLYIVYLGLLIGSS